MHIAPAAPNPSHVLISFCNSLVGTTTLALFEIATGRTSVIDAPLHLSTRGGVTGTAITDDYVFVVSPLAANGSSSSIVAFQRDDFRLLTEYTLASIIDAHSICAVDKGLLVVSTGTDSVVRVGLNGPNVVSEDVLWRPDPVGPFSDIHHLNGVCIHHGNAVVSGFGLRTDRFWSTAERGFIVDIATNERIADAIGHPHSVLDLDETIAYCESSTTSVRIAGSTREQQLPGYTRGLCRAGNRLIAGTSVGRRVSKSTRLSNRADPGISAGRCTITVLSLPNLDIERETDVSDLGTEIYDLQAVSHVERWPILEESIWTQRAILGARTSYEERHAAVAWLTSELASRDEEIARLRAELERCSGTNPDVISTRPTE